MNWYVLMSVPNHESIAAASLIGHRFQAWVPSVPVERRKGNKHRVRVTVARPLFPGYLFALLDPAGQHWGRIKATVGVRGWLTDPVTEEPARLSDGLFQAIREIEEEEWRKASDRRHYPFRVGSKVRITEEGGASQGIVGIVERLDIKLDKSDRAVLSVILPGPSWRFDTCAQWLEAV